MLRACGAVDWTKPRGGRCTKPEAHAYAGPDGVQPCDPVHTDGARTWRSLPRDASGLLFRVHGMVRGEVLEPAFWAGDDESKEVQRLRDWVTAEGHQLTHLCACGAGYVGRAPKQCLDCRKPVGDGVTASGGGPQADAFGEAAHV